MHDLSTGAFLGTQRSCRMSLARHQQRRKRRRALDRASQQGEQVPHSGRQQGVAHAVAAKQQQQKQPQAGSRRSGRRARNAEADRPSASPAAALAAKRRLQPQPPKRLKPLPSAEQPPAAKHALRPNPPEEQQPVPKREPPPVPAAQQAQQSDPVAPETPAGCRPAPPAAKAPQPPPAALARVSSLRLLPRHSSCALLQQAPDSSASAAAADPTQCECSWESFLYDSEAAQVHTALPPPQHMELAAPVLAAPSEQQLLGQPAWLQQDARQLCTAGSSADALSAFDGPEVQALLQMDACPELFPPTTSPVEGWTDNAAALLQMWDRLAWQATPAALCCLPASPAPSLLAHPAPPLGCPPAQPLQPQAWGQPGPAQEGAAYFLPSCLPSMAVSWMVPA